MPARRVTDSEIIGAVARLRDEHGAITYRMLGEAVGLPPSSVHRRVHRLIAQGRLAGGHRHGDVRVAS